MAKCMNGSLRILIYVMCLPIIVNPIVIPYFVKLNDGNIGGWSTCELSQLSLQTRMRALVSNSFGLLLWCFITDHFQVNCKSFDECCRIIQVKSSRNRNLNHRKGQESFRQESMKPNIGNIQRILFIIFDENILNQVYIKRYLGA